MSAENFSNIADGMFKIFATIAIVAGGGWALFEYYDAKNSERIERSMRYVHSLETEKLNGSIAYITKFWSNFKWSNVSELERDNEIIRIVYEEEGYQYHLKNILNHLDELTYCIEHKICDEDIVLKSKGGLIRAGFHNHLPWIRSHRSKTGHKKYFEHLECFVVDKFPNFEISSDICNYSEVGN